jgi:hypothetical protein
MNIEPVTSEQFENISEFVKTIDPEIQTSLYELNKASDTREQMDLTEIKNLLIKLNTKLDNIFGDHILINGKWKQIP